MQQYINYIKNNWKWKVISGWSGDKIKSKMIKEFKLSTTEVQQLYRLLMDTWTTGQLKLEGEWSAHEIDMLTRLCETHASNLYIQKTLKKFTITEIKRKRELLNLQMPNKLTTLELKIIRELEEQGKSARAIANTLGRDVTEVNKLYFKKEIVEKKGKASKPRWAEHEEILELLAKGWSRKAIAMKIGRKRSTVDWYISMWVMQPARYHFMTEEIKQEVKQYRAKKWTYKQIANHYHVSYGTMYNACRMYDIS